jgi:hypothetical protein
MIVETDHPDHPFIAHTPTMRSGWLGGGMASKSHSCQWTGVHFKVRACFCGWGSQAVPLFTARLS